MINILHLLWIIPVSILLGVFMLAIVSGNKNNVSQDICKACKDEQHCEWWCGGTSFILNEADNEETND